MANQFTRQALFSHTQKGNKPEYLFFWGHTSNKTGLIGKECLSQWYPSPFGVTGQIYLTAEHWMMAEKARLFKDEEIEKQILAAPNPREAKTLGRLVRGFDVKIWEEKCMDIVIRGNVYKFYQNPALKDFLSSTGEKFLVEASPYDKVWGIGLKAEDPRAQDPDQWLGQNKLGFALMVVREGYFPAIWLKGL